LHQQEGNDFGATAAADLISITSALTEKTWFNECKATSSGCCDVFFILL